MICCIFAANLFFALSAVLSKACQTRLKLLTMRRDAVNLS